MASYDPQSLYPLEPSMPTDWLDLPTSPALPGLFVRAMLHRTIRGDTLPTFGIRGPVNVEPERLARYLAICGFTNRHLLPATYPHILVFPLQMRLLTDSRFPFPLLGLVHLENRIRVLRPLDGLGPYLASVQVDDLQPHEKGVTFSLIARLEDSLGPLWEGDSRLLLRGLRLPDQPTPHSREPELLLEPLSHWRAPTDIGRRYARVAGDYNPIHLAPLTARLFGFPRAIAHGLWNKARCLAALGGYLPTAGYEVETRFRKPVLLPEELTLLTSAPDTSGQFSLRGPTGMLHLTGAWRPS